MKNEKSYTNEEKRKRKLIVAILLFCSALLIFGVAAAFYSAYLKDTADLTASTLKISSAYTYSLNGNAVDADGLKNLNPGDVIVIKGTITSTGNQSAWLQEKIIFDRADEELLNYLRVFSGEFTQADLIANTDSEFNPNAELTESLLPITAGAYTGSNKVINGAGPDAQRESGNDFTYLESDTYNFTLTIYFMHSAPNATQGKAFGLTIETRALQFKNNNAAEPDPAAWEAIVPA